MTEKLIEIEEDVYCSGLERGHRMVDFIQQSVRSLEQSTVLDLGCLYGGISMAFAKHSKRVFSIDTSWGTVLLARNRAIERNCQNVFFSCASLPYLGLADNSADLVILNGVLEWVPAHNANNQPHEVQKLSLEEIQRVLRPGGILYLAIENRFFPGHLVRDPHTRMPLTCALPRWAANWISKRLKRKPYHSYIYSWMGYRRILSKAGCNEIKFYLPIFDYRFPRAIVAADDRDALRSAISNFPSTYKEGETKYEFEAAGHYRWVKKAYLWVIWALRLQKWLAPHFVILAKAT